MNMDKRFAFSVVIPVYNAENYLEDTIRSIIRQSIGFCENIEIILINNGTRDNSGAICERYARLYPDNIKYIVLEKNAGPSGGRNIGAAYATGEYINFLDSDDKWGLTAFEQVRQFFERHPEINVAACREKRFDAINGWHIFDYIFDNDREVVDIFEEPDCVWFASHSLFLRRSVAETYRFDEAISDSEDMEYVNQILLHEKKYGAVHQAVYYYRERSDGGSLVQTYTKKPYWYFEVLPRVTKTLIALSEELYGECIPYLRWLIMFNLQGRTRSELPAFFSDEECERYRRIISDLLQLIDDEIIWKQRLLNDEQKINVLKLKYGNGFGEQIDFRDGVFYFQGMRLFSLSDTGCLALEQLSVDKGVLHLTARTSLPDMKDRLKFSIQDTDGAQYEYKTFSLETKMLDRRVAPSISSRKALRIDFPLKRSVKLSFVAAIDGTDNPISFRYGRFFPLTNILKFSHYYTSGWLVKGKKQTLTIQPCGAINRLGMQIALCFELLFKRKMEALRTHLYVYSKTLLPKRKEDWIISDRKAFAGDNGEYLFKYVSRQNNPHIRPIFSIDSASPDVEKLKKYGPVLANDSDSFKLRYLLADKVISSHLDNANMYPLGAQEEYLKDLVHSKRVYLQHGVIKDDLTMNNGKLTRNIYGFITSGKAEHDSLLTFPYGYQEENVWLTGLARYDAIYDCSEGGGNTIVIAPTWRDYFNFKKWDDKDGLLKDNADFCKTEFYKFYSALLNDQRLLSRMKECGYAGAFRLHPVMIHFAHFFNSNDAFAVETKERGYREKIESAALFITDYSSTAFDYAYTYRPCIYAQFDRERFVTGHTYKPGYFDYERDGFGPVCYDYESTVQAIISAIENGCVMEEKYRKRAEEFFAYRDGKNCERIYNKILEMDREA